MLLSSWKLPEPQFGLGAAVWPECCTLFWTGSFNPVFTNGVSMQGSIRDNIKGYWVLESPETSFSGFASGNFQSKGTNLNLIAVSCPLSLTYFTRCCGGGIYRCWMCCVDVACILHCQSEVVCAGAAVNLLPAPYHADVSLKYCLVWLFCHGVCSWRQWPVILPESWLL